jgi:hypothetical protein
MEDAPPDAPEAPTAREPGVAALLALPAGTVVCFVDAAGPLAAVKTDKARWTLRPVAELAGHRAPGAPRRRAATPRRAPRAQGSSSPRRVSRRQRHAERSAADHRGAQADA